MEGLEEQIKLFTNEIVQKSSNYNDIKKNVLTYKNFLINTKLISNNSEISKWLDIVINNSKIIMSVKELYGYVDLVNFIHLLGTYNEKSNDVSIDSKHYGHYHSYSSGSCGSIISSDSCGNSSYERTKTIYSSSCGSSSSSTDRC